MSGERTRSERAPEPQGLYERLGEFVRHNINAVIVVVLLCVIIAAFMVYRSIAAARTESAAWHSLSELSGNMDAVAADDFRLLKKKFPSDASNPWVDIHTVRNLYREGRLEEAREEARIIISRYPKHDVAWLSQEFLEVIEKELDWKASPREFPRRPPEEKKEETTAEGTDTGSVGSGEAVVPEESTPPGAQALPETSDVSTQEERQEETTEEATPVVDHPPSEVEISEALPMVALETAGGRIVIELFEDDVPNTVANFIQLVERGFYDGKEFFKADGRIVQVGCPENTGHGGPGYKIRAEISPRLTHVEGSVAMARVQDREMIEQGKPERAEYLDTAGSQFYIVLTPLPDLDGKFSVFGRVVEGMEIAHLLTVGTKIVKATVIRKRSREYVPETISE